MYSRELVEQLLPAVWDPSAAFGIRNPLAPDDDMPRGSVNVAHGNVLGAHLADIRSGWVRADIRIALRQAMFLHFALGMRQQEASGYLGVGQQGVSEHIAEGVGRLTAHLNREAYQEGYDPEATDLD